MKFAQSKVSEIYCNVWQTTRLKERKKIIGLILLAVREREREILIMSCS